MEKPRNILILVCLILALAAILIALRFYRERPQSSTQSIPQIFAEITPGPKISTIVAPNGKMTLLAKETTEKKVTTVTFSTQKQDGSTPVEIYSESLPEGTVISVPYNTFSPDNKYIFLKKVSGSGTSYFVVKTDGTAFAKGEKTIDFVSLFNEKYPDTPASQVTGWGGMTLIVVNVNKPDGTVERSYWYDASSNSFISLTTRFN